jgi:hypothetical protein
MSPVSSDSESRRQLLQQLVALMKADGVLPLRSLGDDLAAPQITGYRLDRFANARQLVLTIEFPTEGMWTEDQVVIPLPPRGTVLDLPYRFVLDCVIAWQDEADRGCERYCGVVVQSHDGWEIIWDKE